MRVVSEAEKLVSIVGTAGHEPPLLRNPSVASATHRINLVTAFVTGSLDSGNASISECTPKPKWASKGQ